MNNILQFKTVARLTDEEARDWAVLKEEIADAEEMAEWYDCSPQTIRNIKQLKTRRAQQVYEKMDGVEPMFLWSMARRFTEHEIETIRESKAPSPKLAKQYDVSPSTIRMIKTGKTYANR